MCTVDNRVSVDRGRSYMFTVDRKRNILKYDFYITLFNVGRECHCLLRYTILYTYVNITEYVLFNKYGTIKKYIYINILPKNTSSWYCPVFFQYSSRE